MGKVPDRRGESPGIPAGLNGAIVRDVARGCLIPDDASPALILLDVVYHRATGWIGTTTYAQPLDLQLPEAWPRGGLSLAGALVAAPPSDRLRPFLYLEDTAAVEVYLGELTIPSGRAIAVAHWRPLPDGLQSSLRLQARHWTNGDRDAAATALRWLENWRGTSGRPRLEEEDDAGWKIVTQQILEFKAKRPTYPLKQICAKFDVDYELFKRWRRRLKDISA